MLKEFTTPKTTGKDIKNNIKNVLSKKYGALNTRYMFDKIPDKDVEDNIETAQNTIQTNIDRGLLNKNTLTKLPYLQDGLSVSFAASDMGNSKAATMAREAAYTEEPLVKETGIKLYSNDISSVTDLPKATSIKSENSVAEQNQKNKPAGITPYKYVTPQKSNAFETGVLPALKDFLPKTENETSVTRPDNGSSVRVKTSVSENKQPQKSFVDDSLDYLKKHFGDDYNVGKTTVDLVINEAQLKSLHKYLTNEVENMQRPNNIGKGLWAKQTDEALKWVDDMFGKSSKLAKGLKALPAITVGIDTLLGVNENIKNKSGAKETLTDAGIDIGFGATEAAVAAGAPAVLSYFIPALAGGAPGLIAGILAGLAANYALDHAKYGGDKTLKERFDSKY